MLPAAEPLGGLCSCGRKTTTRVAALAYCSPCAQELLDRARGQVIASRDGVGLGRQNGPLRLDWGRDWAMLACEICEAGWVGPIDEPCAYCATRRDATTADQRRLLLLPELPDRGDKRRTGALKAWADRLANAVAAGVVNEHEARTTWKREQ